MSGNAAEVLTKPGFRKIEWLERDIAVDRRPDGVIVLKSRIPLKAYEKHIPASLAKWAGMMLSSAALTSAPRCTSGLCANSSGSSVGSPSRKRP